MSSTREGFQWTRSSGLQSGLPCEGVIQPPHRIENPHQVFDVLIIGAGYTGLTAGRDLTAAGFKILMLEGRDRIGGRTWTSHVDGYPYEMGGTWVHWFQPHVYRELSRYGMGADLVHCPDYTKRMNYFTFVTKQGRRNMSHEEEQELTARALGKFVDVDGNRGKTVMPFAFDSNANKDVLQFSNYSVADRIDQIRDQLSEDEIHAIEATVLVCSGGTCKNSAFLDFLRWWAASNHDYETFMECVMGYKLKHGQSSFALKLFDEALQTGNLSYSFDTIVSRVDSSGGDRVAVYARDRRVFFARRLVCTMPLNVLTRVTFNPPLDQAKVEASTLKHVNQCVKVHAEIKDPEMRSWSGMTYPDNKLLLGAGDGTTGAGNTHVVFFGCDQSHMHADENIDDVIEAVNKFAPMDVQRLVFHNWSKDEFASGAWVWYRPGMKAKYLDALRKPQGPVYFANSDWADGGWRSFIDGAIQSGTETALAIKNTLQSKKILSRI